MRPLLFVLFLVAVPAYGQDFYYERPNPNLFRTQDIDVTLRWSPFSQPPVVYYAPLPQPRQLTPEEQARIEARELIRRSMGNKNRTPKPWWRGYR